jgi:hypothetical protein
MRNTQPMLITGANINATVTKRGVFKSKHVANVSNAQIAPNSKFAIPVKWDFDKMQAGKYDIDVSVKANNYWNKLPMTWHYKKTVTVSSDAAKKISSQQITKPISNWIYAVAASGVVLVGSILGLVYVNKNF